MASKFRNTLIDDGFTMHQFSVYVRHCPSKQVAQQHIKRIKRQVPPDGHVSILQVTDLQYSEILNLRGRKPAKLKRAPRQLELF